MSEYQYYDFRAIDRPLSDIVNLRDAYELQGNSDTFRQEFKTFMTEHSRRKAFITRLEKAGLL